jgi:hypothetical protein
MSSAVSFRNGCPSLALTLLCPAASRPTMLRRTDLRIFLRAVGNPYQENVYADDRNFISFRKVVKTMAASSDASEAAAGKAVEMISFHSVSKGFIGECGIRGGYFELHNIDDAVKQNLYKLASISLCSNTHGQVLQRCKLTNVRTGSCHAPY